MSKVPEVTILFWIVKIMLTTVGETAADFLKTNLNWGLITDNLKDNFGVSLETTTIIFTFSMLVTFAAWYMSQKTLSIHSILTAKREAFYWLAILFTFALGTAAGDLIAEGLSLSLGYWKSALLFAALIGMVTIAHSRFKLNSVLSFWIAYILTRPLGASLGDYLSQSSNDGGLNLGTVGTSVKTTDVIGGTAVISDDVKAQLPSATRYFGKNAYETNVVVLKAFDNVLKYDRKR